MNISKSYVTARAINSTGVIFFPLKRKEKKKKKIQVGDYPNVDLHADQLSLAQRPYRHKGNNSGHFISPTKRPPILSFFSDRYIEKERI